MAERVQTYKNHTRNFPLFHFFALPVLALNFLNSLRHVWMNPNRSTAWGAVLAAGLVALGLAARVMAVTVQDRLIRLEMQLRMQRVLPPDLQARCAQLSPRQLVALRFAGDNELAGLVREVLEGRLETSKQIKEKITNWQADWLRA